MSSMESLSRRPSGLYSPGTEPPSQSYQDKDQNRLPPLTLPPMLSLMNPAGESQQNGQRTSQQPQYSPDRVQQPPLYHSQMVSVSSRDSTGSMNPPSLHAVDAPTGHIPLVHRHGGEVRESITSPFMRRDALESRTQPESSSSAIRRRSTQWDALVQTSPTSPHAPRPGSIPISGLLSSNLNPILQRPPPTFSLRMRQQPLAARACGFGERDRRVIDPPPILQMNVVDPQATPDELRSLLRQPYAVVHCTLWDPVHDRDDTAMPGTTDKRQQRRLMGTLVASPFVGKDEFDVDGCFFPFPDLSVRTPGVYCLRFSLVILSPERMAAGCQEPIRHTIKSSSFQVFNAKDFSGMTPSTELTKRLKHQGCQISVKKGNVRAGGSHSREDDDDQGDE